MNTRFRITQTLLNSWLYVYKTDSGWTDFINTLNHKKNPPTKAILDGIKFENIINACLDGQELAMDLEWFEPISRLLPVLNGAQKQVTVFKNITVDGVPFVLHGVLDFLKAGVIFDTKFSQTYKVGKYLDSPQHPMYFELVPEAYEFQYLVCDGKYVYKETYQPDEVEPIEAKIRQFMNFLDRENLVDVFCNLWKIK
ncbi:MAG: hypothetical protein IJ285_00950 [Clostridia bacterium]|nr:hypothetical protein [Clostridia bacterium]